MPVKTSHSQSQTYIQCPQHWKLKYRDGLYKDEQGSPLTFGSAVDDAVSELILSHDLSKALNIFRDSHHTAVGRNGEKTVIFDNDKIDFYASDFDDFVMLDEDNIKMDQWKEELKISNAWGSSTPEMISEIGKAKKNTYKKLQLNPLKFYNRCCWLSLLRKGEILVKAFNDQVLPKITKVHAIQKEVLIEDPVTKDKIMGFIDFVLEIEGYDKPIIFDLKTSGQPYKHYQLDQSDQLTLYLSIAGHEYNTDLVGYIVLIKSIAV